MGSICSVYCINSKCSVPQLIKVRVPLFICFIAPSPQCFLCLRCIYSLYVPFKTTTMTMQERGETYFKILLKVSQWRRGTIYKLDVKWRNQNTICLKRYFLDQHWRLAFSVEGLFASPLSFCDVLILSPASPFLCCNYKLTNEINRILTELQISDINNG